MKMLSVKKSMIAAGLVAGVFAAEYARAAVVEVHQFVVMRTVFGGALGVYMNDDFNDTAPPPSTEAVIPPFPPATVGSPVPGLFGRGLIGQNCDTVCTDPGLPDGYTTMDSDTGVLVTATRTLSTGGSIFVNELIRSQSARFATPATNTATGKGLKSSHQIHVVGLFRLVNPDLPRGNYGIGFTDGDNDILNLSVLRRGDTGETFIYLLRFEGTSEVGVVTPIGSVALPEVSSNEPEFEFIVLRLRTNKNNSRVFADFAFSETAIDVAVNGLDAQLAFTPVTPTDGIDPTIFNPPEGSPTGTEEHFTRAQFRQSQNLDEAAIAELMTGSPATLSQIVDTPDVPFNLNFNYRFGSTTGQLTASLVDTSVIPPVRVQLGGEIDATGPVGENFTTAKRNITSSFLANKTLTLEFELDGPTGSTVDIDNVLFPSIAESKFTEGVDGASSWVSGGDGAVGVVILETPADAVVAVDKAEIVGDRFEVSGVFETGVNSDGLHLPGEDVTVVLGDFVEAIPSDSFVEIDTDVFKYEGDGGAIKEMIINVADGSFKLEGEGADLSAINSVDPAAVHILIGNDLGVGESNFEIKG